MIAVSVLIGLWPSQGHWLAVTVARLAGLVRAGSRVVWGELTERRGAPAATHLRFKFLQQHAWCSVYALKSDAGMGMFGAGQHTVCKNDVRHQSRPTSPTSWSRYGAFMFVLISAQCHLHAASWTHCIDSG